MLASASYLFTLSPSHTFSLNHFLCQRSLSQLSTEATLPPMGNTFVNTHLYSKCCYLGVGVELCLVWKNVEGGTISQLNFTYRRDDKFYISHLLVVTVFQINLTSHFSSPCWKPAVSLSCVRQATNMLPQWPLQSRTHVRGKTSDDVHKPCCASCVCVFMRLSVRFCLLEGEESTWQELLCHRWDLSFLCLDNLCSTAAMSYRTVVMYMEIGCFVVCVSGWILVCSTMPTEIWTWSEVDSIVLTTSNYFSNLWKDCISDSTGVSDCKGIPSMLALNCK